MTRFAERALAALFVALAALFVAGLLARATLHVSRTFNEGWNAYHAASVFTGQALYPPPGALIANNYPPLSFLLTALVMHVEPDAVFAGRILAAAAFLAILLSVALIVRASGADWRAAAIGAAALAVYMAVSAPNYIGMDDPQMLAHAIMLAGAWLLLRRERPDAAAPGMAAIVAAALLMAAGLFVKHNLIALPIAATLWLAAARRANAVTFVACLLLAGLAGLAASRLAFGPDFVRGMLSPRQTSLAKSWHDTLQALGQLKGLLALALLAVGLGWPGRPARFLGLYLAAALAVGALAAAGADVGDNAFYELAIACAIGAGHLAALAGRLDRPGWAIAAVAVSVLCAPDLATAKDMLLLPRWLDQQRARAAETDAVVAFIAARPGPALCETTVFCYWAGKPFALDAVNFRQGLAAGTLTPDGLIARLARGEYATVALDSGDTEPFPPAIMAALRARYAPVPVANPRQVVYVPLP